MYRKTSLSKHINMGSSFEDLDARSLKVKMNCHLSGRFSRYIFFKFSVLENKSEKRSPPTDYKYTAKGVQSTLIAEIQVRLKLEYK